jgi:hypothetical protein
MAGRFFNVLSFTKTRIAKWSGFTDPTTGYIFINDYKDFNEVLIHVKQFREDNKIESPTPPFKSLSDELQAFFCEQDEFCGECVQNERYVGVLTFVERLVRGGGALIKATINGSWVPFEAEQKRANQCSTCPFNNTKEKFYITDRMMITAVHSSKLSEKIRLGKCDVCSCPLRAKIRFPSDIIYAALKRKDLIKLRMGYNDKETGAKRYCWMVSEVEGLENKED